MIPASTLTLADLHQLRARYGGTVEVEEGTGRHILRDTVIDGRRITLGPVPGPVRVEVTQ